jgi:geranylgeranyl diphosphate synthase type I
MGWVDANGAPAEATGKRLRPVLCLLACKAAGGDTRRAIPAAAALELVHNFSLIHDDIQDEDRIRHGRDTVWAVWGAAQAINAGDALLALAHVALAEVADRGVPTELVLRANRLLNAKTLEMVQGQVLDIAFESRTDVGVEEYLDMIGRKSAALFEASLAIGGMIAGADLNTVAALSRAGRLIGVTFQVRDDALGVWGSAERTGKSVGADILRRKKTLPAVYVLTHATSIDPKRLADVYSRAEVSKENAVFVAEAMASVGARAHCEQLAQERSEAAIRQLEAGLPPSAVRDELVAVARYFRTRES